MTTVFPGGLDNFTNPTATDKRNSVTVPHAAQHANVNDAVEAIESVLAGSGGPNVFIDPAINLWPVATSFASIADGTWGPAGLIYRKSGAAVHDLIRSTDVPAVAATNPLANYSAHLDVTTADASIAAGDYALIATRIEGYDWKRHLDQRIFSFGFWVKAAKTGIHCVFARNSGNDRSCVIEYTVNAANTWEYKTVTFPAAPSTGTWNYTNGRGIEIGWTQYAGSTFQTTAGAWQTGNFYATANQVNEVDSTANNFRIALLGPPTAGAFAAPFAAMPIAQEEARFGRYYEEIGGGATTETIGSSGQAISTTQAVVPATLTFQKRAAPTVTESAVGDWYIADAGNNSRVWTAVSYFGHSRRSFWMLVTIGTASLVAGNAGYVVANTTLNARFKVDARLP